MAQQRAKGVLRGFLIQDHRYTTGGINFSQTNITESNLIPDYPVFQGSTGSFQILATGTPTDPNGQFFARTLQGGQANGSASTFCWRTGSSGEYYGRDPFHVWNKYVRGQSGANVFNDPGMAEIRDGNGLLVGGCEVDGNDRNYNLYRINTDTGNVTSLGTAFTATSTNDSDTFGPRFVTLENGRILMYYYIYDNASGYTNIQMAYSDDNGNNWTVGASKCLDTDIDRTNINLGPIAVAQGNDQFLMLIQELTTTGSVTGSSETVQYASYDGMNFASLGSINSADEDDVWMPSITFGNDFFYVAFVTGSHKTATSYDMSPNVIRTAAAGASLTSLNRTVVSNVLARKHLSIVADNDGFLHLYADDDNNSNIQTYSRSNNGGITWTQGNLGTDRSWGGSGTRIKSGSAIYHKSAVWLACNNGAGVTEGSLNIFQFGGATNVNWPTELDFQGVHPFTATPHQAYFPNATLGASYTADNDPLTRGGDPVESYTSTGSYMLVYTGSTGLGEAWYTDLDSDVGSEYEPQIMFGSIKTVYGTGSLYVSCVKSSGNTFTEARLDYLGGADKKLNLVDAQTDTIKATVDLDNQADRLDLMLYVSGAQASAWWAEHTFAPTRYWNVVATGSTLSQLGSGETAHSASLKVFGPASGGSDPDGAKVEVFALKNSRQGEVRGGGSTTNTNVGFPLEDGFNNPSDLIGFPYNNDTATYVSGGVSVLAYEGVTYGGDVFKYETDSLYPLENIFMDHSTSPGETFRTANDTAGQSITIRVGDDNKSEMSLPLSPVIGISLRGINFGDFALDYYDTDSSSFVELGYFDNRFQVNGDTTLTYQRRGTTVYPDASTGFSTAPYLRMDELKDGHAYFGSGNAKRIEHNTEGYWIKRSTTSKFTTLHVPDLTNAFPASGSSMQIFPPNAVGLVYLPQEHSSSAYRLRLAPSGSGVTPNGYFEIGQMVFGPVVIQGWDWSESHSEELEPNVETTEFSDGKRRTVVRGKTRKVKSLTFQETAATDMYVGPDDYLLANANSYPVSNRHDSTDQMMGLFKRLQGSHEPVIFLPHVRSSSAALPHAVTLRDHEQSGSFYGRIVSTVSRDVVLGEELTDEIYRLGTITIEEEL